MNAPQRSLANLAAEEAVQLRCNRISPLALLLAVLRSGGPASRVLVSHGISVGLVRSAAASMAASALNEEPNGQITFDAHSKNIIEEAIAVARRYGHNNVTPEHVLLALLDDKTSPALAALAALGIDAGSFQSAVAKEAGWQE